jgi:hypothetical protein
MKCLIKFIAIFGLIFITVESYNITFGSPTQYDVILHRSVQIKSSKFYQVVTLNVTWPEKYERNNRTITAIRLIDQVPKSSAYVQIYSGGVGFNHTTLHLKSERNKKLNYILEIYGRLY